MLLKKFIRRKYNASKLPPFWVVTAILWSLPAANAGNFTGGSSVVIPMAPSQSLPANDLVFTENGSSQILNPKVAWDKEIQDHVDLSLLEPDTSTKLWNQPSTAADKTVDEALEIQDGDEVSFLSRTNPSTASTSASYLERARFNAVASSHTSKIFNFIMSKKIHTFLLRKVLLRRLGYKIPAMKWIRNIKVRFPDEKTRDDFLKIDLPLITNGARADWEIPNAANTDPLLVELKDVVVTGANADTNLAIAPLISTDDSQTQILPMKPRILRALSVPYGLVNLGESLNQFEWTFGSLVSNKISFDVPDNANFNCSYDDAAWMLRRLSEITRDEFAAMVKEAYFPGPVGDLLVEKLISRRNGIIAVFNLKLLQPKDPLKPYPVAKMDFDSKYTEGDSIENGKVQTDTWAGYVSKFKFDDNQSPLHDIQYYFISQIENNVVQNLLNKANAAIPGYTNQSDTSDHQQKLLNEAMTQFQQTGQNQFVPHGLWVAPLLNGGLNISRNVVIGNYMGTNNMVAVADSFGVTINAGLMVGTDGLPTFLQAGAQVLGSVSINYTHLKPMYRLKQTITEPFKNEIVPLLFKKGGNIFAKIATAKADDLANDFKDLQKVIDVGESFIITESLNAQEQANLSLQAPTVISPQASAQLSSRQLLISRLQIYRKDSNTIQVYKDNGNLLGFSLSLELSVSDTGTLPVLLITRNETRGSGETKIFKVTIGQNLVTNPNLPANAAALAATFKYGNVHILESAMKPAIIQTSFKDKSGYFRFLHRVNRSLKTKSTLNVTLPDGRSTDFISLNDGRQKGAHYQQLGNDVADFLLTDITQDPSTTFSTQPQLNPGQSFLGHSQTRNATFQARVENNIAVDPFLQIQYYWQGWQKKASDAQALFDSLSNRLGFKLYPDHALDNVKALQLYQINLYINVYENGLKALASMTPDDEDALESKYRERHHCFLNVGRECAAIHRFKKAFNDYRDGSDDPTDHSQALARMASHLEEFADFADFLGAVGGANHIYIYSNYTGFKTASEISSQVPNTSYTFGKVDSPYPNGILSAVESILDVSDGEFYLQWLREVL